MLGLALLASTTLELSFVPSPHLKYCLLVTLAMYINQDCQIVYFQTKNLKKLGEFCRVFQWKMLVFLMAFGSIIWPFDVFCGHLVYFMVIWVYHMAI
jgi:hypothetical protein